jgi:CDP-2,3-bis-(O-geranylgeranyl)-sn-glycerol synthase
MDYLIIIQALWLVLPAYIANGMAQLVGGGKPIDFGKKWKDGRRILGDGKTWRGLITGAFLGVTCGFGFSIVAIYSKMYPETSWLGIDDFTGFPFMIPIIGSICFGALLGDIIESFFKRRIGKNRGDNWIPFDQLDFILGVLFFSFLMNGFLSITGIMEYNWFLKTFTVWHILVLLILTPFFHLLGNLIAKKAKPKNSK